MLLATLAVGYTLWAAQALILPILLAMFFALVGCLLVLLVGLAAAGALSTVTFFC